MKHQNKVINDNKMRQKDTDNFYMENTSNSKIRTREE